MVARKFDYILSTLHFSANSFLVNFFCEGQA